MFPPFNVNVVEGQPTIVSASLQDVLNNISSRLLLALDISESSLSNFTLISKWGCDGSGGQSLYKQKMSSGIGADSKVFSAFHVPLRLVKNDGSEAIVWSNPAPNSSRLCTPIRLGFFPENSETIRAQTREITCAKVNPSVVGTNRISHVFFQTMIDGKTLNALSGCASNACPLCKVRGDKLNSSGPQLSSSRLPSSSGCTLDDGEETILTHTECLLYTPGYVV